MKAFLVLISFFLLCACERNVAYYPSEKEHLSNAITKKVAIQLKNELELTSFGSGGQAMDEIKMLALAFIYRKPVDIETGRKLLIAAVEKFAAEINSNEDIRPYLGNYPFGPKNIEIEIYIQNPDGREVDPEKLSIIVASEGMLKYKINSDEFSLKTIHQEKFEEALELLNHKK
jgi:hypothetical protein